MTFGLCLFLGAVQPDCDTLLNIGTELRGKNGYKEYGWDKEY
jgi:hypothetical protein